MDYWVELASLFVVALQFHKCFVVVVLQEADLDLAGPEGHLTDLFSLEVVQGQD